MIRRDSSSEFLRQKQRQWELEKAESESGPEWFPFGENLTPGGGSPLRKHHVKTGMNAVEICEMQEESTNTASCSTMPTESDSPDKLNENHQKPPPQHTYPYPMYPAYTIPYHPFYHHQNMTSSTTTNNTTTEQVEEHTAHHLHHNQHHQQFFAPQYQVIPAGAIPVSTISIDPSQICPVDQMGMWAMPPPTGPNGMRYGIPIPAPFVPQIMTTSTSSNAAMLNAMMMTSSSQANHNDSSSESGVSGVKDDEEKKTTKEEEHREERQSTSDYTDDDPIPLTRRSTGTATCNYAEQIAERRRVEQEEENRERVEMLEIERQRRILDDRRNSEEQQRILAEKKRLEEESRRSEQFAQAMEKARREAELLKKAKLYKHVLRGAEEEGGDEHLGELEQKILGVDYQTGRRLLKEVSDVEWHKKQDQVEIRKKAPQPDKEKEKEKDRSILNQSMQSQQNLTQRGRSSSISQSSPFSRNTSTRRSVRTTSREKQEIQEQVERQSPLAHRPPPPRQSPRQSPPSLPPPSPPRQQQLGQQEEPHRQDDRRGFVRLPSTPPTFAPRGSDFEKEAMMRTQYYRVDRGPLSQQEQTRILQKPTTTPTGPHVRQNDSSIGLFSQIPTRSSCRRGQMRGPTAMQSPVQIPSSHRSGGSFEESSSGGEDTNGSVSPDLSHKHFESPLPSSTENVHPAPESPPPAKNERNGEIFEYKSPLRTRSALGASALNDSTPRRPSSVTLQKRLESMGHITKVDDSNLSEDIRHVATASMSRAGSLAEIRGSIQNLSVRSSHLNLAASGEPSPNLSKFASVNSTARQSLSSMRKTTERQAAVLERLSRLRESLHSGKNYAPPRGSHHSYSTASSRIQTPAATPPISPRPST